MSTDDRYPAIFEADVHFKLRLCSPDVVNDYGRTEAGLTVQAKALTHNIRDLIMVSWPPVEKRQPGYEYGMTFDDLCRSLGYEILSNRLHLFTDPKGR